MQFKSKLIICAFCCAGLQLQGDPAWWSNPDYQLIDTVKSENDSALVVQGQAKQAYAASKRYFDDAFIQFGGAGENIDVLFESNWFTSSTYDYNVLLNGQLKSLAHPFFVRLGELEIPLSLVGFGPDYTGKFPWTEDDPMDDVDYSPALIGQVKYVFSFDLELSQDGDDIPDWWEYVFETDTAVDKDNSNTDSDGDSRSDSLEYTEKTNPTDYYDDILPELTIVSGNNQQVVAGTDAMNPIVVRVDKNEVPLNNAPLEVELTPTGSGELGIGESFSGSSISARTNQDGELLIDYSADADFEGAVTIDVFARSESSQLSIQAWLTVVRELSLSLFGGVYQTYIYNQKSVSGAGRNEAGQLAGQTDEVVNQFSKLSELPAGIVKIATGDDHALALDGDGTVYAWGDNFFGQLGLGDFSGRSIPTPVPDLSNVIDVAAGDGFSSYLVDNGDGTTTIYLSGNLKDGLKADLELSNLPIAFGQTAGISATQLAAAGRHLLIVCANGSVWGWGQNTFGQINPASTAAYLTEAVQIIDSGVIAIATSPDNSLALTSSNELKAWGNTAFDQLASGTQDPETGIYMMGQNVVHATLGNGFIAYLGEDDGLMTAGLNDSGQLGRDTGTQIIASAAAVARPVTDAITTFVSGDRHLVYLTESNEIYGFGDNRHGALGVGATEQLSSPTLLTPNLN